MDVKIEIDTEGLDDYLKKLAEIKNDGKIIFSKALNSAAKEMKKNGKQKIKEEYTAKVSSYASGIKVIKAKIGSDNPTAGIRSNVRTINLAKFNYRANRNPGKKGAPTVFARVKKDGGGYTGDFVADMGNGKAIYKRTGKFVDILKQKKQRYWHNSKGLIKKSYRKIEQVKRLDGPSGTEMLNNEKVKEAIMDAGREVFINVFDKEAAKILKG